MAAARHRYSNTRRSVRAHGRRYYQFSIYSATTTITTRRHCGRNTTATFSTTTGNMLRRRRPGHVGNRRKPFRPLTTAERRRLLLLRRRKHHTKNTLPTTRTTQLFLLLPLNLPCVVYCYWKTFFAEKSCGYVSATAVCYYFVCAYMCVCTAINQRVFL